MRKIDAPDWVECVVSDISQFMDLCEAEVIEQLVDIAYEHIYDAGYMTMEGYLLAQGFKARNECDESYWEEINENGLYSLACMD